MANQQIKIFVINLKRSPQRRVEIETLMNRYSLKFEFFEAVDGKLLSKEVIEKSQARSNKWYKEDEGPNESMKLGEIGVARSHYYLYEKIINENLDLAIILEDDAHFDERFSKFIKWEQRIFDIIQKFDLILLGYCTHDLKYKIPAVCSYWGRKKISKQYFVGRPVKWYWSAIGYIISKRGALYLMKKQGEFPCVTADILTANSPQYGVRLGILSTPIIWPGPQSNFSTIQIDSNPTKTIKSNIETDRAKYKYLLIFRKKLQNLKSFIQTERMKIKMEQYLFTTERY